MNKNTIKEKYNLSERLFWKLISEHKITRLNYRDYTIDEEYFKTFSVNSYWEEYGKRPEIVEKRKIANALRSEAMKKYHKEKNE